MRNFSDLAAGGNTRVGNGTWWTFGQMFFLPMQTFVYGMAMLVDAMRGTQRAGDRGTDWTEGAPAMPEPAAPQTRFGSENTTSDQAAATRGADLSKEERRKVDQTLNDDRVKLVRYTIVSVERDCEKLVVRGEEELVTDNIESDAYIAWKIAQHCRDTGKDESTGKFLRVYYEVLRSWERPKEDSQVKVLKEIRDNIGGVRASVREC